MSFIRPIAHTGFMIEVSYSSDLFEGMGIVERDLQGDPNYKILTLDEQARGLSGLLQTHKVVRITGVPNDAYDSVLSNRFGLPQKGNSNSPHQDTTYFDPNRHDTRRWNLFSSTGERESPTFVYDESFGPATVPILKRFLEGKKDRVRSLEREFKQGVEDSDSEAPYPQEILETYSNGTLLQRALKGDRRSIVNLWTLTTKWFKDDPDINCLTSQVTEVVKVLDSYSNRRSRFHEEHWIPGTILVFDNLTTYHGRLGPSNVDEGAVKRLWIADEVYNH